LAGWVDSVAEHDQGNWAICRRLGLWGTASANPVNAVAGDDLFLWKSGQGWLAHCRLTGHPQRVLAGQALPWPATRKYQYTIPIDVIAEPGTPLPFTGTEAAVQAGFGPRRTSALGQFSRVDDTGLRTLRGLFEPLSPIEASLTAFLRAADVAIPADLDARDFAQRLIAVRRGQARFREDLLRAFEARCCISGSAVEATLEAAHIRPYRGVDSHAPGNGLLLRADLHTLFDLHLITVMPFGTVRTAPELRDSEYEQYDERQIRPVVDPGHRPSRTALEEHNAACPWLEST
jgi:hypothetical protein